MRETTATEELDGRTVVLLFVTVAALTVVDAVLGRTLLGTTLPALVADGAVASAVVLARRHLLAGVLLASAASAAVSVAVFDPALNRFALDHELIDPNRIVGLGAWPGLGELAGLAVLAAMAVRRRPEAEAAMAAVAYGGALWAVAMWRQQGMYGELFQLILGVAFAATVASALHARASEQRQAEDARSTRQAERDAIARELHDLVAHHVTGIVVQAQAARLVADTRPDVTAHALASIEQAGADALSSMRAMVGALRADHGDAPIAPTATVEDIRRLATVDDVTLPVAVSLDAAAEQLPGSVIASLHRIAIEALTNARRHGAGATMVDVAVACRARLVVLSVTNDGAVVTERRQGFGLVGIAERVAALGGQFQAGPRPTGGWALTAVLPTTTPDTRAP